MINETFNFWTSTFLLPKGCIKKIKSLCSRFLWSGNIVNSKPAKVAWSTVCLPKKEGGLALRRYGTWNTTLCLRLIWLLFSNSGSLWVAWHKYHHIRDGSFWSIQKNNRNSWNWNSLLDLRPLAERFIKCLVGTGKEARFWFDSWTPFGPLIKHIGEEGLRSCCIPIGSKVVDVCDHTWWNLPSRRSDSSFSLHIYLTSIPLSSLSSLDDTYNWFVDGITLHNFSSSHTWNYLRPRSSEKPWHSSIWFKYATPKQAFLMWIAHLNRLPTRVRLAFLGMQIPTSCCLCSVYDESRDHLLLRCTCSQEIWNKIPLRLRLPACIFYPWIALLTWNNLQTYTSPSLHRRLASHSATYHIWKQRNNVLHNHQLISPSTVFKEIDKEICNTITTWRHRRHYRDLMILWIR